MDGKGDHKSPSYQSGLSDSEMYDLIGIGFGPASLAIAIALHDLLEQRAESKASRFIPKVKFLERQSSFGWHTGMLLPGTRMQISFLKDLATMRNPRSHFTFLNYLQHHNRLVQFANLNTFLPLRIEFEHYLKWSANHFADVAQYSQEVVSVKPVRTRSISKYDAFEVVSRDVTTNTLSAYRTKSAVIAIGGRPSIPQVFHLQSKAILHSSRYNLDIDTLLPDRNRVYRIAVVGAGQSAAEVFNDLQSRFPNCRTNLIMRDSALRPSDDSPFVNEVFNPEMVDTFYTNGPDVRASQLQKNRTTNYSVVRLNLLEEIYEKMCKLLTDRALQVITDKYLDRQRLNEPNAEAWSHRIRAGTEVVRVVENGVSRQLELSLKRTGDSCASIETLVVDAVVLATGYARDVHNHILKDCQIVNGSSDGTWVTERGYNVQLDRNLVDDDVQIYLQGCNEQTHGLSDTLLSILATRGGEIVDSIFGKHLLEANTAELVEQAARMAVPGPLGPLWGHLHHHPADRLASKSGIGLELSALKA